MIGVTNTSRLRALQSLFTSMCDTIEWADKFDSGEWEGMIHALDNYGRLVFGFPLFESSESDIFGALDDIADQLAHTKADIERTTADVRVILGELRDEIGMGEPKPDAVPGPRDSESESIPSTIPGPTDPVIEPEYSAGDSPTAEPPLAVPSHVEEAPSRVGRGAEEPVAVPSPVVAGSGPPYAVEPQTPSEEDERMFALVRSGEATTYAEIERLLGIAASRAYQRFALLEGYGALPADMIEWRLSRKGKVGNRGGKPKPDHPWKSPKRDSAAAAAKADIEADMIEGLLEETRSASVLAQPEPEPESFEDRRKRLAREASERTWAQRHEGASA